MFVFVKYVLYISEKLEVMRKEEVYLDLTKLTSDELKRVAECVKDEMFSYSYKGLIKGSRGRYEYLHEVGDLWTRSSDKGSRKEITYDEFLINFGKITETEKKLYDYAVSVDWDTDKMECGINSGGSFTWEEYNDLKGLDPASKIANFIEKYKPKEPVMVTLPIENYNRLRKLEIKQEIKRLRKEYKSL